MDEFDSADLRDEKEIALHDRAVIEVGPLKPASYHFIGDLHARLRSGALTVLPEVKREGLRSALLSLCDRS